jgi:hypothetical protein
MKILAILMLLLISQSAIAQNTSYPKSKVNFDDFKNLVAEVEPHRASRLIDFDTFLKMSADPGVVILDSRSTFRFERIHLRGAKHLSFTDFTQENLGKLIPNQETTILIYCNNNFEGDRIDFASKIATPRTNAGRVITAQFNVQAKPLMMALNVPTYINLYGYGYHNVYELNELVKVTDPRVVFEGSIVDESRINTILPTGTKQ